MVTVSKKKPKNAPVDLKCGNRIWNPPGYLKMGWPRKMNILPGGMSRRVNGFLDSRPRT